MISPTSVLITGASSGIGAALALAYAEPGRRLALTGRNEMRLEAVAERCREAGATVATRAVFYNNSAYDGNDPAAGAADDAAVAPDKSALLPGQAATFANVTSYTRGINGVMFDLAGVPAGIVVAPRPEESDMHGSGLEAAQFA